MITTMLLTLVVTKVNAQSTTGLAYPKGPRQHIAVVAQSGRQSAVTARTGSYPKDITANLAQPAIGTAVASQKFKPKGAYPKDPRNNLAWP
ncbi:MAG: hypothetical protein WCK51_12910 [Armatimonadota bacterium]